MVVVAEEYPEAFLTQSHLDRDRESFEVEIGKLPSAAWPRIENSEVRSGALVFTASCEGAKDWLQMWLPEALRQHAKVRVGGPELLQRMLKVTAWLSGKPKQPGEILRQLGGFNPTLKTETWRVLRQSPKPGTETGGERYPLVAWVPESQARALEALGYRPYLGMGRIFFKVSGLSVERPGARVVRGVEDA